MTAPTLAMVTTTMGGAGHIARLVAVRNGLRRAGFEGPLHTFGPPIPYATTELAHYQAMDFSPKPYVDPKTAPETPLAQALVRLQPDVLLVDLFWLPLVHILPMLPRTEAWLLLNTVPRTWLSGSLRVRFRPSLFKRLIAIERLEHHAMPEQIEPVVVCNPDECHPPDALKQRLNVPEGQRLVLVLQTGMKGELGELRRAMRVRDDEALRVMGMHEGGAIFPIAPWLLGADRLVGGGGYNFFWETAWLGLRPRTTYTPFPRTIDNQAWRIANSFDHVMRANGADQLARMLLSG